MSDFKNTDSSNSFEEIPFPLKRVIRYTGEKTISFTFNYLKVKEEMMCFCSNTGVKNNFR